MRWMYRPNHNGFCRNGWLTACTAGVAVVAGCHEFPDPFLDDLPQSSMVTTMSAYVAREAPVEPVARHRGFEPIRIEAQDGTVAHAPLWMEDPVETVGSNDGQFAATLEDILYFPYGIGKFLANAAFLPGRMILAPPYAVMCSDGIDERDHDTGRPLAHDAERCAGVTTPPDVHETWAFSQDVANGDDRVPVDDMPVDDGPVDDSPIQSGG